jgi:phosphoenolpyruvate-protein kinase (PTS system EI component)
MGWEVIGSGMFASNASDVEAPLRVIKGVQDIVALMKEDDGGEGCIALTNFAGGSAVSTIIRHTRAIVSTIGGPNSHIVVVARDYNVPCVVGAGEIELDALEDGSRLRLSAGGEVSVWRED